MKTGGGGIIIGTAVGTIGLIMGCMAMPGDIGPIGAYI